MDRLPVGLSIQGLGIKIRAQVDGKVCYETIRGDLSEGHIASAVKRRKYLIEKIATGKKKQIRDHADYVAGINTLNNGITVVGKYQGAMKKITHRCDDGHEFEATPNYMMKGARCPICRNTNPHRDVFYIWENADDPGVYKIGVTSKHRGNARIAEVSRNNGMTANIVLVAAVDDARDIEHFAKQLGDNANYPADIDGYTEFRRYSDAELGAVYQMAVQAA
jgi:hypothetical protein